MNYKKVIINGYILGIGEVEGIGNITEDEYYELQSILRNKPIAPSGYAYKLKDETYEWELIEVPLEEHSDEITEAEYNSAKQTVSDYENQIKDAFYEEGGALDG